MTLEEEYPDGRMQRRLHHEHYPSKAFFVDRVSNSSLFSKKSHLSGCNAT
jgi:hypothetical protein